MANLNRGRDLPRAPQLKRTKTPPSNGAGEQIKALQRRDRAEKALAKATKAHGFDTLFPSSKVMPEKAKQKEQKLVLQALALNIPVHSAMLEFHGLAGQDENPRVPDLDDSKIPF